MNTGFSQALRSLDDFGWLSAIAHGKCIGLSEIAETALIPTIRTGIHKAVQENPVTEMPKSQISRDFEDGVDLALLRKAQQERDFAPIEKLFSMRLL
jgi:hypothetical protein